MTFADMQATMTIHDKGFKTVNRPRHQNHNGLPIAKTVTK